MMYSLGWKQTNTARFKEKTDIKSSYRFLDPIINGQYPYSMQEIVKDRLPSFSDEESRMVKGSIDYVGINHYTSYYMKDPGTWNLMPVSYQDDWHVGFVCKF
jgi:beta-glucosidase